MKADTNSGSSNRDSEPVPLSHYDKIYMVPDHGKCPPDTPPEAHTRLQDQLKAVLSEFHPQIQTAVAVDTGGDVFGGNNETRYP